MLVTIQSLKDDNESTIGTLSIDGVFQCFTLEDTERAIKIKGKTRIPRGKYIADLRTGSPMSNKYADRYDSHKGMIWLRNVHDFKYVYIHIGNTDDDTDGCILVGKTASVLKGNQRISGSRLAYADIYPQIAAAIYSGAKVEIEVR